MESKRFEITETEGSVKGFYVVVDKETGSMSILWTKKVERLCCFLSSSSSFCCGVK